MILGIIADLSIEDFDVDYIIDQYKPSTVLMGGSRNTKGLIEELESRGVPVILFKPWSTIDNRLKHYNNQFLYRNRQIIDNSNLALIITSSTEDDVCSEVALSLDYLNTVTTPYELMCV